jgi:LCP family protein required for cell wall assembly
VFRWVALAIVVAVVASGGYVWYTYNNFVSGVKQIDAISGASKTNSDQNILLVGDDHRPANATPQMLAELGTQDDGGGTLTDTMMVLHVPANGSKATLISFPRDSWVDIPGFGMNKLNTAFELGTQNGGGDTGGSRLLITTIQNLSGLTIDHFVRVSMLGFYGIAKALGPIQVCLNNAVDDPYSTLKLPKGVSTLNAQQALAFVRQRHGLPNGDLDREVRQQYFLSVEMRKMLEAGTLLNPVKLQNVLGAVSASLETDKSLNLLTLASQMHGITAGNLTAATIPILGTPTIVSHGSYVSIVQVDNAAMPAFIANITGTPTPYSLATAAAPASVKVTVLNGGNTKGAATRATAQLAGFGFATGTPGDASRLTKTTIEYPIGSEGQAKALAAYLPGADVVPSTEVTGVTLELGTDGMQITAPGASGASSTPTAAPTATATPTPVAKSFAKTACIN